MFIQNSLGAQEGKNEQVCKMGSLKGKGTKEEGGWEVQTGWEGSLPCHAAARKMEDDTFIRDGLRCPRQSVEQVLHDALSSWGPSLQSQFWKIFTGLH